MVQKTVLVRKLHIQFKLWCNRSEVSFMAVMTITAPWRSIVKPYAAGG